jgi:hypothetical protein
MVIIEVLLAIVNMWDSDTAIMKPISMSYGTIGLWIFGAMLVSSLSEVAYAQLSVATGALQQQMQQQQQSLPNITTDGGLSASVAKPNYNAGDTVVINGTVAKYNPTRPSFVVVEVMDPKERMVEDGRPSISGGGTFRFTFTAGENIPFEPNHCMLLSGEYKVIVRCTPPSIGTLPEREQVELGFYYNNGSATITPDATQEQLLPPNPSPTPAPEEEGQQQSLVQEPPVQPQPRQRQPQQLQEQPLTTTTTTQTTNQTAATNATTTTTTNNTTIITTLVWNPGEEPQNIGGRPIGGEEVQQLSPENIQYQQTDPAFAKLAQTTAN